MAREGGGYSEIDTNIFFFILNFFLWGGGGYLEKVHNFWREHNYEVFSG